MTGFQPATDTSPREGEFSPLVPHEISADPPLLDGPTPFQRELSDALGDEGPSTTHVNDRPGNPGLVFWDVALGLLGIASLLVGVVLVFFFAAAGAIVLLLGGLVCAMAFTGATHASEPPGRP